MNEVFGVICFVSQQSQNLSSGPVRKPAKLALLEFTYAVPRCTQQTLSIPHKHKPRGAVEGGENHPKSARDEEQFF